MARANRAVVAFGAPLTLLGIGGLAAWLSFSRLDTLMGPMTLVPITPGASGASSDGSPPPTVLARLNPLQAELRNALLPYSNTPIVPGASYRAGQEAPEASLDCMTAAVYYEAGSEPVAGQRAVAQVILNRTATDPFPHTVCGVIRQGAPKPGCQFTFMCDGSVLRPPNPERWAAAREIAKDALSGRVDPDVGAATHYHADYVLPLWAPTMLKLVKIGRHIFYRWPGAKLTVVSAPPPAAPEPAAAPALPADAPGASPTASSASSLETKPAEADATAPASNALGEAPKEPAVEAAPAPKTEEPKAPPPPKRAPRLAIPEGSLRSGPF